jgi:hypothetical protein
MHDAACSGRSDLDWFDHDCYLHAVLNVCVTCPVADDCLDYAIRNQLVDGVWGGEWGYRLVGYVRQGRRATDGAP